jgi:transposase
VWERLHRVLLDRLGEADQIDWERASLDSASIPAKRGRKNRSESDRCRKEGHKAPPCFGPKRDPIRCDRQRCQRPRLDGLRRAHRCCRAHQASGGRPRKRPEKLHADKAYDDKKCKGALRRSGIKSRIARKGIESSEKLGRHRWVVECTLAWLAKYRRFTIRYEQRENIHEAFLHLDCSLICFNYLS